MRLWPGIWLLLIAGCAQAADFRPFDAGSRAAIEQAHAGKPFILALWSLDCTYCQDDLNALGVVVRQHPDIALVTVCTDGRETAAEAAKVLDQAGLPRHERWQFSAIDEDRLRYSIDRLWYGELPRSYFYNAAHHVQVLSGRVEPRWLDVWAGANTPAK